MVTQEERRADLERIARMQGKTAAEAAAEAQRIIDAQIARERAEVAIAKQRVRVESARKVRVEAARRVAPVPVTPPAEMVVTEVQKEFGARVEAPQPPVVTRMGEPVRPAQLPEFRPVRVLTPQEVEAGAIPTVFERAAVGEISQAELERRVEEARREKRTREFFEKGGVERLEELQKAREKEIEDVEIAAGKLRELAIPLVGGDYVESEELRIARERVERAFEGVDVTRPVGPAKFAEITEAQEVLALEFGKAFKISPAELEVRVARAEAGGLFESFAKEQRELVAAEEALVAFGGEFLRGPTETEREFFTRVLPIVQVKDIDPELARAVGLVDTTVRDSVTGVSDLVRVLRPPAPPTVAQKARLEFLSGVKLGIHPPRETFAGKVFRATVEAEAKLGPEIGPAAAALGGIGARIIGTVEETGRFLDELFGLRPKRAVVPPPTIISPFLGISPLEAMVHPGRRFISGLAAGAVFFPLETKAFSAGIRGAVSGVKGVTRGIGEGFIFRQAGKDVLKVTQRRVIRLPFGERGVTVGELGRRLKPIKIETLVGKERGPGIVAERFLDRLEALQIARPKLTVPLRPFFGKPTVVRLFEAERLTARIAGRVSRGGVKATERVRTKFVETGVKLSERQFRKIEAFLRTLDPETAAITGVKRARGIVGITEIQFKGLGRRPAQNILRLLSGEKGLVKRIELGDVATKRTTSQLLRQMQFGFKDPGVRGRLSRFFRPAEQRRFFRTVFGERGAAIGERIRPRAPIGVKRVTITRLEPTLEAAPEIVERSTFRRFLETIGIQRAAPGEFREASILERLRISAQPSAEIEKIFKVFPAKKVGVMKPFDLRKVLDIRHADVPPGAVPTETGVGGLQTLLTVPGRVAERGRLSFRLLTGVPVKVKPAIRSRLSSLLRLGGRAAAVAIAQPRIRPVERPVTATVSGESAKVVGRIKVGEIPISITRPIQQPAMMQQQQVRQQQALEQAVRTVITTPVDVPSYEGVGFHKMLALPPQLEEAPSFEFKPIRGRRITKRVRTARVVSVEELFNVPMFKTPRVGHAKAQPIKIKIPEIKLPFSEG